MRNIHITTRAAVLAIALTSIGLNTAQAKPVGPGCADLMNEWDQPTADWANHGAGPTGFEIVFAGNVTASITTQITNDATVNPFHALFLYNGSPVNPTTVHYDSSTNTTTVRLSGGALPLQPPNDIWHGGTFQGPTQGGISYHPGLNAGFITAIPPGTGWQWKRWTWSKKDLTSPIIPFVNVRGDGVINGKNIAAARQAVTYVLTEGVTNTGTWNRNCIVPEADGTPGTLLLSNFGPQAIKLGVVGVVANLDAPMDKKCLKSPRCDAAQKNLEQLNDQGFPPPGADGSPFTVIDQLTGTTLQPNETVKVPLPK